VFVANATLFTSKLYGPALKLSGLEIWNVLMKD
jgi:hypothetical protein